MAVKSDFGRHRTMTARNSGCGGILGSGAERYQDQQGGRTGHEEDGERGDAGDQQRSGDGARLVECFVDREPAAQSNGPGGVGEKCGLGRAADCFPGPLGEDEVGEFVCWAVQRPVSASVPVSADVGAALSPRLEE
jgi:hypothetical protein